MLVRAGGTQMIRLLTSIKRFARDRRGVAAIEFAFIAPVLLVMYFITMEFSQAIETSKKVSRLGSMVADLVTQQPAVTDTDLKNIMKIGDTTLRPYHRSTPTIAITAIQIGSAPAKKATVLWSIQGTGTTYVKVAAKDSEVTNLPTALKVADTFLIRVNSTLTYTPVIAWAADGKKALGLVSAFSEISMGETYYLRPRRSQSIACTGCPT